MTADAHIITAERSNVLRVPLPATRFNPEGLNRAPRAGGQGQGSQGRGSGQGGAARTDAGDGRPGAAGRRAQIWLLRDGKLVAVRVHTGLDDGTLIEVAGDDLKAGDAVVVNAVRPNAPTSGSQAENRPPGTNPNVRGGGVRM